VHVISALLGTAVPELPSRGTDIFRTSPVTTSRGKARSRPHIKYDSESVTRQLGDRQAPCTCQLQEIASCMKAGADGCLQIHGTPAHFEKKVSVIEQEKGLRRVSPTCAARRRAILGPMDAVDVVSPGTVPSALGVARQSQYHPSVWSN
jgi:hypothetical protein